MSGHPFWLQSSQGEELTTEGRTTSPLDRAVPPSFAELKSTTHHFALDQPSAPTVHQILQAKMQQYYHPETAAPSPLLAASASSPSSLTLSSGWPAGTPSAFAAASASLPSAWPASSWDACVPDSLEAAYGNYLDQPAYACDADGVGYSSGLPTPELAADGYNPSSTFQDPFEQTWSPQSLASPVAGVDVGDFLDGHDDGLMGRAVEGDYEAYGGCGEGYHSGAVAINPALCSPEVAPADVGLHLPAPSTTSVDFSLYQAQLESYMPSPVSRRGSLAPISTPISLAPLPPLPPLPPIPSTHPLSPSLRLNQLTTLALARRRARGVLPPARSSLPSRSGSHSRDPSQYAHSPSTGTEDELDLSEDDEPRKGGMRARTARSTGRRVPVAARARAGAGAGGVAGFAARCDECGVQVATLHFRGKADALAVEVRGEYVCVGCAPVGRATGGSGEGHRRQPSAVDEEACAGYEATLSAVLDRLQTGGSDFPTEETISGPRERLPMTALGLSGMNKAAAGPDVLCCDVCKYALARGQLVPVDSQQSIAFGVEAVCPSCKAKFARCSDCGGGGGPRLGVGKWRSLALFPGGRKTCQLSHLRLGALDEMSYDVHRVSELPKHELGQLLELCSEIHYTSVVTALATPDALEGECPAARTFEEVHRMGVDGWALYEHLLQEDVEASEGKRRYVGLRWSTPVPRKKAKPAKSSGTKGSSFSSTGSQSSLDSPLPAGTILRPSKKLVGVVIGELDLAAGSLFLPLTLPSSNVGESYDGQTGLYLALHRRIRADLDSLNATRSIRAQLPALREAWTLAMVRKDARGLNYLEKRRGYVPLEAYVARHGRGQGQGDVGARLVGAAEEFMPGELLPGWAIFVREVGEGDEWAARTSGVAVAAAAAVGAGGNGALKRKGSVCSEGGTLKKGRKRA